MVTKTFHTLLFICVCGIVHAQYITTPPVQNGTIAAGEYGTHTVGINEWYDGSRNWYLTWDANYLYMATINGNANDDELVIYIDTDPTTPANTSNNFSAFGNLDGIGNFDNINYGRLPFSANFNAHIRNGYHQHRTSNNTWSGNTDNSGSIAKTSSGNTQEIRIAWSTITGGTIPASFNIFFYLNGFEPYGGNAYYDANRDNDQNNKLNLTGRRYFNIESTTNIANAFKNQCYINPRNGANAITNYGTAFHNITLNTLGGTTATSTANAALTINGSLYISGSDILNANNNSLTIKENIQRYSPVGALDNLGTVTLNGTADQQQIGHITYTQGLVINKPSGLLLFATNGSDLGMEVPSGATLTLTNGIIDANTNNAVVLIKNGASINQGNENSYIKGKLKIENVTGATASYFPVGFSKFNPCWITNNGSGAVADNFTVNVGDYLSFTGTASIFNAISQAVNRTWHVEEDIAGGSNVSLKVQWNLSDTLPGFLDVSCFVGHFYGGVWVPNNATAAVPGTVANSFQQSRSPLTSFSPFGVASAFALPLRLMEFNATKQQNGNTIHWKTSSEEGNFGYTLQYSTNGITFENIYETAVNNNRINGQYLYNYFHHSASISPAEYYRLQLRQSNGYITYSNVIKVNNKKIDKTTKILNLGNNTFALSSTDVLTGKINITASNGQLVQQIKANNSNTQTIQLTDKAAGTYLITYTDKLGNVVSEKVVVY